MPGYCLLLADPVVASLNELGDAGRTGFLGDMARLGDAILQVTSAERINYRILGNSEPELHAHVFPRYATEPPELRRMPAWFYDWAAAPRYEPGAHAELRNALRAALIPHLGSTDVLSPNGQRTASLSRDDRPTGPNIRLGSGPDVDRAVDVYRRSNLARRGGRWPNRDRRLAHVRTKLQEPDGWFLVAEHGDVCVAMAAVVPLLAEDGQGPPVAGASFLSLLFVVPERWGEGIGGAMLDAVLDETGRRGVGEIRLWTHEDDNERAHRLYRRRLFSPTGRTWVDDEGEAVGEWVWDHPRRRDRQPSI